MHPFISISPPSSSLLGSLEERIVKLSKLPSMPTRKNDQKSPVKAKAKAQVPASAGQPGIPPPEAFKDMETYMAFLKKTLDAEVIRRTDYLRSLPHLSWAGLKHEDYRAMASYGIDAELGYCIIGEEDENLAVPSGDPEFFLSTANFDDNLRGCFDTLKSYDVAADPAFVAIFFDHDPRSRVTSSFISASRGIKQISTPSQITEIDAFVDRLKDTVVKDFFKTIHNRRQRFDYDSKGRNKLESIPERIGARFKSPMSKALSTYLKNAQTHSWLNHPDYGSPMDRADRLSNAALVEKGKKLKIRQEGYRMAAKAVSPQYMQHLAEVVAPKTDTAGGESTLTSRAPTIILERSRAEGHAASTARAPPINSSHNVIDVDALPPVAPQESVTRASTTEITASAETPLPTRDKGKARASPRQDFGAGYDEKGDVARTKVNELRQRLVDTLGKEAVRVKPTTENVNTDSKSPSPTASSTPVLVVTSLQTSEDSDSVISLSTRASAEEIIHGGEISLAIPGHADYEGSVSSSPVPSNLTWSRGGRSMADRSMVGDSTVRSLEEHLTPENCDWNFASAVSEGGPKSFIDEFIREVIYHDPTIHSLFGYAAESALYRLEKTSVVESAMPPTLILWAECDDLSMEKVAYVYTIFSGDSEVLSVPSNSARVNLLVDVLMIDPSFARFVVTAISREVSDDYDVITTNERNLMRDYGFTKSIALFSATSNADVLTNCRLRAIFHGADPFSLQKCIDQLHRNLRVEMGFAKLVVNMYSAEM